MTPLHRKAFRRYALALVCTLLGAWLTEVTDSMLPLALGGAALVMATAPLVQAIRSKNAARRDAR